MVAYKVGDEVGFARNSRYGYQAAGFAIVSKVNGHGHITLENGKIFDKHGSERGTNYGLSLIDAGHLRTSLDRDNANRARKATVQELIQKLNDSFSYSGTAHIDAEKKAELLALVNSL